MRLTGRLSPASECSTSAPTMPRAPQRARRWTSARCLAKPSASGPVLQRQPPSSQQLTTPSHSWPATAAAQLQAGLPHGVLASNVVAHPAGRATKQRGQYVAWQKNARDYGSLVDKLVKQTQDVELELFSSPGTSFAAVAVNQSVAADAQRAMEQARQAVCDAQRHLTARIKATMHFNELRDLLVGGTGWKDGGAVGVHPAAAPVAAQPLTCATMDSICLSAAFCQLPKLLRGRKLSDADRRDVALLVESHLLPAAQCALVEGRFDAQGLVSVAVGLAKLEIDADPAFTVLLVDCSRPLLPRFTPQGLSNFIWALATMEVQPSGAWLTDFYAAVEAAAASFNGQDIANTLWGLCRFDLMPEVELLEQLLTCSLAQLGGPGTGQDSATVITCTARYYCKYNYKPRDDWLYAYMAHVQPYLRGYAPADLVSVVHSLVCMNVLPRRDWMVTFYDVLKDRLMFDPALAYHDFSRLLGSLSRIDYTPTRSWLRDFVRVSAPKLSHLRYRALSELAWALACWDCKPSPEWLQGFLKVTASRMDDFRPRQLAIALAALAHLKCKVPAAWLDRVLKHFVKNISEAKAHDLVDVLESVGICEDAGWLAKQSSTFHLLADTAASKFGVFDAAMHVRLVVALARVSWGSPSAAWLIKQQAALLRCWSSGDVDAERAAGLRQAYASWEADMDAQLEAEMMNSSSASSVATFEGELDTPAV